MLEQLVGCLQDAVVVALGQDDVRVLLTGLDDEVALEEFRADDRSRVSDLWTLPSST